MRLQVKNLEGWKGNMRSQESTAAERGVAWLEKHGHANPKRVCVKEFTQKGVQKVGCWSGAPGRRAEVSKPPTTKSLPPLVRRWRWTAWS